MKMVHRRKLLKQLLGFSLLSRNIIALEHLSSEDDSFLEDLEKASFQFFWEQSDPQTGLVKDRCSVNTTDKRIVASIAATGFGLTAICIADKRGYIPDGRCHAARNRGAGVSVEVHAHAPRLLLSLGQFKDRRTNLGFGSIFD